MSPRRGFFVPFDSEGNMLHAPDLFVGRRSGACTVEPVEVEGWGVLEGWGQIRAEDRDSLKVEWRDTKGFSGPLRIEASMDRESKLIVVSDRKGHLYPMTNWNFVRVAARYGWDPAGDGHAVTNGDWVFRRVRGRFSVGVAG